MTIGRHLTGRAAEFQDDDLSELPRDLPIADQFSRGGSSSEEDADIEHDSDLRDGGRGGHG